MLQIALLSTVCLQAQSLKTNNLRVMADSLYALGNYTAAMNTYAKVGTQKAQLQIARAYNAIGNYQKAIAQYENVVAADQNLQIARFELAKLYLKTRDFDTGRKLFSALAKEDATNPEYQYYQGETFRELGQESSSLVSYKKAIAIDSTHLRSLFRLGKYFTVRQERDPALLYVDQGLRFYEGDVSLINLKALILYNDAQFEKAIPWFEKVLELQGPKEYVYTKLAYCYYKNWEFEKAKSAYKTLLEMDKTNADAYFGLGTVYHRNKQIDSAEIAYKKAMEVQDPVLVREYHALATLARSKNDLKLALDYYQKAFEEDTSSPYGYYQICTVADQYYKDPKLRLELYENYLKKFGKDNSYYARTAVRRIRELKEELHFKASE